MAVSRHLRYEVLRRDNHACRYCGDKAPDVALTVDHVIPTALGGNDDPSNLVAACRDCNSGKSATPPDAPLVADVAAVALRWSAAMAEAQRIAMRRRDELERSREYFHEVWLSQYGDDRDLPERFGLTIDSLISAGLTWDGLEDAVEAAANTTPRDPFRYFCGVAWRKVADLQEIARQIHTVEEG